MLGLPTGNSTENGIEHMIKEVGYLRQLADEEFAATRS
jgi:hypothetical protein